YLGQVSTGTGGGRAERPHLPSRSGKGGPNRLGESAHAWHAEALPLSASRCHQLLTVANVESSCIRGCLCPALAAAGCLGCRQAWGKQQLGTLVSSGHH